MPLTNEQAIRRFKIVALSIPINILLFFISIFLTIYLELRFPLPMLIFPLMMMAILYLVYWFFKYPEAARQLVKKPLKNVVGVTTDMIENVDEKVIGNKLGGVINHMTAEQANSNPAIKIRCQHCQTLNEETDKFCSNCGKPL